MSTLRLDIVTAERLVYSEEVDLLVAPGIEGSLGILPKHSPLMTILIPGEIMVRRGPEEFFFAISGGFLDIMADQVIVLADSAERDDEIDLNRAEEARARARALLDSHSSDIDVTRAEAALHRSVARINVATKGRRKGETPKV